MIIVEENVKCTFAKVKSTN